MKPAREHATNNSQTYFVTSDAWERRALFRAEPWARLFFKTLLSHRGKAYLLHEFVLMPDHFHLLISPVITLERAVQLIKGGFSFRVKKEIGSIAEIWQRGFSDHRIRDAEDYAIHVRYIHFNPVKKHLCEAPADYKYSSAFPGWKLDPVPQRLKPQELPASYGTAEAVPFQNTAAHGPRKAVRVDNENASYGTAEAVPFQNTAAHGPREAVPVNNENASRGTAEAVPFQNTGGDVRAEARTLQRETALRGKLGTSPVKDEDQTGPRNAAMKGTGFSPSAKDDSRDRALVPEGRQP